MTAQLSVPLPADLRALTTLPELFDYRCRTSPQRDEERGREGQ